MKRFGKDKKIEQEITEGKAEDWKGENLTKKDKPRK